MPEEKFVLKKLTEKKKKTVILSVLLICFLLVIVLQKATGKSFIGTNKEELISFAAFFVSAAFACACGYPPVTFCAIIISSVVGFCFWHPYVFLFAPAAFCLFAAIEKKSIVKNRLLSVSLYLSAGLFVSQCVFFIKTAVSEPSVLSSQRGDGYYIVFGFSVLLTAYIFFAVLRKPLPQKTVKGKKAEKRLSRICRINEILLPLDLTVTLLYGLFFNGDFFMKTVFAVLFVTGEVLSAEKTE